jgi:phosphoglycerate dehydrogenase-like enzyme
VERVFGVSDLTQLAAQVDHLVACLPATPQTAGMINRTLFSVMKPESYFYNVGRGSTVVTEDLVEALHRAGMAGAGLDVVDPEPLPVGHPLWHHPNVIMTSHTAGETNQYWERAVAQFEQNLRHYLSGNALVNSVDLVKGY